MKTLIIAYINIEGKSYPDEANKYLVFAKAAIQNEFGDKYKVIVVPITKGQDRVEFKYESGFNGKPDEVFQTLNENFSEIAKYVEKTFKEIDEKLKYFYSQKDK